MAVFTDADAALLIRYYTDVEEPLDTLPYTQTFERIYHNFVLERGRKDITRADLWTYLIRLRKQGRLPTKKRKSRRSTTLFDESAGNQEGQPEGQ